MAHRGVHGPPYFTAQRIFAHAKENWANFDGTLALSGGPDPRTFSPERLINAYVVWVAERLEESKFASLRAQWNAPPRVIQRKPTAREREAEGAAFMSFMAAHSQLTALTQGGGNGEQPGR